jgi:predicted Zn-dependent peptidase
MEYHLKTLANGLPVIYIDTKAFPTLTTLLLVGAGSRYEHEKNNGIAHFFEHMAFKGSAKYPNSFVISSTIESLGGVFNAFTSKDHTGYWIKAPTEDFETVVDVLSDMVLKPLLVEDEIEREKGVIVEEINLYEDTPYRKVNELFEELLYRGNPLGYDIAGTKETVRSFNRETFVDYIGQLYHPKNSVLVVAGGIQDEAKTHALVEQKFKDWQPGTVSTFTQVTEAQQKPAMLVRYKKTEQAHFCIGFRSFSLFDARKHPLSILSAILGGGMSSRLFIEVRERRGLCYYISTGREMYHDVGNFVTQAGVTNSVEKVKEAVKVILEEHQKIVNGQITEEEVEKAKEFIKGRFMLSLEDSQSVASFFGGKQILEQKIETPEEVIKKLQSVTRDEVVAVAKDVIRKETLNFAMIGPIQPEEITEKDLEF